MKKLTFLLTLVLLLVCSCISEEDRVGDSPSQPAGGVIDFESRGYASVSSLRSLCDSTPQSMLKSNLEVFKLVYSAEYLGRNVKAEALLLVPRDVKNPRLAAYFHGARVPWTHEDPLSSFSPDDISAMPKSISKELKRCALPLASNGYCVVVPDYIGYGLTSQLEHPFVYYPELFKANRDALRAARSFLNDQLGIDTGKKVFLCGWSQGGGACLSAHRYIQEGLSDEFEVVASSSVSGAYDMENLMLNVFSHKDSRFPSLSLYAWSAYAVNRFCPDLMRPADQLFLAPVYDQLSVTTLFNNVPESVFRPSFMSSAVNGSDAVLRSVLKEICCFNWMPSDDTHIYLHHGTSDDVVPYFNSVNASESFKSAGAANVELISYQAQGHDTFLGKYMVNTIRAFNSLP